jgi:hypothetical protein
MRRLHSTGVALIVALFLALALFTTGALAHTVQAQRASREATVQHAEIAHTRALRPFGAFRVNAFRVARIGFRSNFYRGARFYRAARFYRVARFYRAARFYGYARPYWGARVYRAARFYRYGRSYRHYHHRSVYINVNAFSFAGDFGCGCDCCWSACGFAW